MKVNARHGCSTLHPLKDVVAVSGYALNATEGCHHQGAVGRDQKQLDLAQQPNVSITPKFLLSSMACTGTLQGDNRERTGCEWVEGLKLHAVALSDNHQNRSENVQEAALPRGGVCTDKLMLLARASFSCAITAAV